MGLLMALFLVTAPSIEPITLADAKLYARINFEDEDALIAPLIRSAREYAEGFTHRAFLTQTWDLKRDDFPDVIELPMPPVSSVTSVSYVDTNGTTQTWSTSLYTTDLPSGPYAVPATIRPAYQQSYPATRDLVNAVTVRFVAGYGATRETVPDLLRIGIMALTELYYARMKGRDGQLALDEIHNRFLWPFKAF